MNKQSHTEETRPFRRWLLQNIPLQNHDSPLEEKINSITHMIGVLFSIIGGMFLIHKALASGEFWITVSCVIYILCMTILYSASAFYHWVQTPITKRIGRIMDHVSIYLLIAGTYTPIAFRVWEPTGLVILNLVWGIVIIGVILRVFFWGKMKIINILLYIAMGWLVVFFWGPVTERISPGFFPWCFGGGITYTAGVAVYVSKKLPFYHGIWHLFVLAGSICFYFGIYFHIVGQVPTI